jgi:hypothetical protein
MRTMLLASVLAGFAIWVPGCGATLLLRVYTVSEGVPSHVVTEDEPNLPGLKPVGGVRFFFYPYVRDSVIHQVPEREFVTDSRGRAEYVEIVSPLGEKMGALVAMKGGYLVDTVLFSFDLNDTVTVIVRMRPRPPGG